MLKANRELRGRLNNTMNRERDKREREQRLKKNHRMTITDDIYGSDSSAHPVSITTSITLYANTNPLYDRWEMDKNQLKWFPEKISKMLDNVENINFGIYVFSVNFFDTLDALYRNMERGKCMTDREYEEIYKCIFNASFNVGKFYFEEWEKIHFGASSVYNKWHHLNVTCSMTASSVIHIRK